MTQNTVIPNTFQNPNDYVDQAMELLTGEEFKCLTFAVRHILGWKDSINERKRAISFTTFEHGFTTRDGRHFGGTGLARVAIQNAVNALDQYGLLVKGELTPEGQEYEIGESPDWDGLRQRATEKLEANRKRTAKARSKRPSKSNKSVSPTDQFAYSQTNQPSKHAVSPTDYAKLDGLTTDEVDGLTETGQSDLHIQTHDQTHLVNPSTNPIKDSAPQPGAGIAPEPKTIPPPADFSSSKPERSDLMEQSVIAPRVARPLPVTPQEKPLTPQEAAAALREAKKQIGADVDPVTERKRDLLFDAVAQHVFRITSDEELKQLDAEEHAGTRIGIITSWLRQKCDRVKLAKGRAGKKVGYISHVAEPRHVEQFGAWCVKKGYDPPMDLVKFVDHWRAFASEKKSSQHFKTGVLSEADWVGEDYVKVRDGN